MKLLTALTCFALSFSSLADDYVIALSPFHSQSELKKTIQQSMKFAVDLNAGDTVYFIDGYSIAPIARINIPENIAYRSPKARLKINAKSIKTLMQFAIDNDKSTPISNINETLRTPQLLRYVSQNFTSDNAPVNVILVGSPLYDDPADKAFSMADGLIPSDGHLQVSPEYSVYSVKYQEDALKNIRLHWAYTPSAMKNNQHKFYIERFWQLYSIHQGGEFVSFDANLETVLQRVKDKTNALPNPHALQKTERLEMIRLRETKLKTSIYDRPLSQTAPTAQQIQKAEKVEIGIAWLCQDCDLDLYVRPVPSSDVLYYGRPHTSEGIYYKDFRSSPSTQGGFETIELTTPIDLRALSIAVNFYQGQSKSGVKGQIRIAINDKTYAAPFVIQSKHGNKGVDTLHAIQHKQSSLHSLIINPLHIVKR